jgi:uncharacterized protein with FMN-binding domain
VLKKGRKGRVSNELVAASCAAIVAVYAAGAWRTRDADQHFGAEGQVRRPTRPAQTPAVSIPDAVAAAVSRPAPLVPPAVVEPKPVPKKTAKVDVAPAAAPAVVAKSSQPAVPAVAAATAEATVEPAPASASEADVAADEVQPGAATHPRWLDGYYTGWGTSRHGDIQAFVRIEDNKIVDAGVASCETRYPCDVIDRIIRQPIELQGPDVDRVSRATESADAYYYGLVTALENAQAGTFRSKRP